LPVGGQVRDPRSISSWRRIATSSRLLRDCVLEREFGEPLGTSFPRDAKDLHRKASILSGWRVWVDRCGFSREAIAHLGLRRQAACARRRTYETRLPPKEPHISRRAVGWDGEPPTARARSWPVVASMPASSSRNRRLFRRYISSTVLRKVQSALPCGESYYRGWHWRGGEGALGSIVAAVFGNVRGNTGAAWRARGASPPLAVSLAGPFMSIGGRPLRLGDVTAAPAGRPGATSPPKQRPVARHASKSSRSRNAKAAQAGPGSRPLGGGVGAAQPLRPLATIANGRQEGRESLRGAAKRKSGRITPSMPQNGRIWGFLWRARDWGGGHTGCAQSRRASSGVTATPVYGPRPGAFVYVAGTDRQKSCGRWTAHRTGAVRKCGWPRGPADGPSTHEAHVLGRPIAARQRARSTFSGPFAAYCGTGRPYSPGPGVLAVSTRLGVPRLDHSWHGRGTAGPVERGAAAISGDGRHCDDGQPAHVWRPGGRGERQTSRPAPTRGAGTHAESVRRSSAPRSGMDRCEPNARRGMPLQQADFRPFGIDPDSKNSRRRACSPSCRGPRAKDQSALYLWPGAPKLGGRPNPAPRARFPRFYGSPACGSDLLRRAIPSPPTAGRLQRPRPAGSFFFSRRPRAGNQGCKLRPVVTASAGAASSIAVPPPSPKQTRLLARHGPPGKLRGSYATRIGQRGYTVAARTAAAPGGGAAFGCTDRHRPGTPAVR